MATQKTNDFSSVPHDYPLCLNHQCPKASTCLRQLVEQEIDDNTKYIVIVNPKYLNAMKGDCPNYRCSAKVQFAKGFIGAMANLSQKQLPGIAFDLTDKFSRRTYYRIRKGERLLSPAEQQAVRDIFKRHGIVEPIEFDDYVEDYQW